MLKQCIRFIFILLFSLLALQVAAEESDVDPKLEQQLDQYLELAAKDKEASTAMLEQLYTVAGGTSALQSRARLLGYLTTNAFYVDNLELSDNLLEQLLNITEQTKNPNALSEIYATELELLLYKGKLNEAIIKTDLVKTFLEQATDLRVKYYANNVLARLYRADSQYGESLQHFIQALEAIEATDNALKLRRRIFLNYNIAHIQVELKNWSQARDIAEQLIADATKYEYTSILPELYLLMGFIAGAEKQPYEAIRLFELGIEATLKVDWEALALVFENNIGAIYIELAQYSQAKQVLQAALARALTLEDEASQQLITLNLGYIRVMNGEHNAGLAQMRSSLDYFEQHSKKADYEPMLEWLAKAYAAVGMYQQQAETLSKQMQLREDVRSVDRDARLSELHNRFENKSKAQKIIILEQENTLKAQLLENKQLQQKLTFLFVVLMLFAAVALYFLYRKVRQSNKKLSETNQQLAIQSQRDPLTGLYNRRALHKYMEGRSKKRRENDKDDTLTGILMLDIDFFKRINDHYGHSAGDAVLIEVSKRLLDSCREQDLVVRWGGEEILLLLNNISLTKVPVFIKRILDQLAQTPVQYEQHSINITVSGGFIHLPFSGVNEQQLDWEKVMQIADMALYLSKANGRNQVCMVNSLTVEFELAKALLYSDLSSAIQEEMVAITTISGTKGNVS